MNPVPHDYSQGSTQSASGVSADEEDAGEDADGEHEGGHGKKHKGKAKSKGEAKKQKSALENNKSLQENREAHADALWSNVLKGDKEAGTGLEVDALKTEEKFV